VTTPQDVAMNVAVKAIGMFNKLNVPIVGVVENMSYLQCPHCNEQIDIFGKGGGKKISEDFKIPFIGEIPLHPRIRESSDIGRPSVVSEPESVQAHAFTKTAKVIAGRISILAAEIKAQEQAQNQTTEQAKEE
jgi:ATP-binding protein involved in chromosome partitioning